jgi:hypothetical protein
MISAASAQIEAISGDHMKTTIIKNGKPEVVPDYAKVQGILLAPRCHRLLCHFHHHHRTGVRFSTHFFLPTLGALICAFFLIETMDLTLSKRRRGSRMEVINGIRLKMKRKLRTPGQNITTKNHEVPFRSAI